MMKNKLFRQIILCFIFSLCATALFAVPLTGVKTIGGISPDYATFSDAVTDLNLNGVGTGGVMFLIRDGNYTGNVTITAAGTAADPILFQSQSVNAGAVVIEFGGSGDVVKLQGASYVTLSGLTIDYTANLGYSAIEISANSDFVSIIDCILDGSSSTSTTFATSTVYANESSAVNDCDSVVVANCTIRNGSYGIYFGMSNAQPSGMRVTNNRFENSYGGGVYLESVTAPVVRGNNITTTQTGNSSFYGIYLNNCDGKSEVTNNYVYTSGLGEIAYGIYLSGSASTSGNNALLANNSLQISNTASIAVGIDQSNNSTFWDILSNTVYVSGGTSSTTIAYRTFTFADGTAIRNNIFANFASGVNASSNQTVYIANTTGVSAASHNCYWTANGGNPFRANYAGDYSTLAAYASALGETNAVNIDPQMTFVANVGWKATNPALTGAGLYMSAVPEDIDNNTRLDPTTIGAHENGSAVVGPPNDNICDAINLGLFGSTSYDNTNATAEGGEPVPITADCTTGWCPADGAVQNSVWFSFTLLQSRNLAIATTGIDNQIALYSAASCSTAFTLVAASDSAGAPAKLNSACLSAGTYYLQIDGFQGAAGSGTITVTDVTLSAPVATAPTNTGCTSFTANWNTVSGATGYFIDVATDNGFTNLLPGYTNANAGSATSFNVSGLAASAVYYYRVRATDGCTNTVSSNVTTATTLAKPVANFQFNTSGADVSFTNTSTGAVSYQWSFGDGNTSADTNPSHTYAAIGNYQVQLIATNTCGADTATQNVNLGCSTVAVNISTNHNKVFCEGDSAVLTTIHSMGNSYQWLRDNQPIGGANAFNYTAKVSGDYALSVTDLSSCSGVSLLITIVVNPNPVVTITADGATTFCAGNDVELSTTLSVPTYQWLNNAQPINNADGATYAATTSGNYTLSVTDANGCSDTSGTITVTVTPGTNWTVSADGPTTFCMGDDVELTVIGTGVAYQWLNGGQPIDNATSATYTATASGSYAVSATDSNSCTSTSNAIAVTAHNLPTVSLTVADTVCLNDTVFTLTGGAPTGGNYFVDGSPATVFNPKDGAGTYEIEYTYTDGNNCGATATANIVVDLCTGVEGIPDGAITIFPNPASEFIVVQVSGNISADNKSVHVFDVAGKEVIRQPLSDAQSNYISVKNIPAGKYFAKVMSENETLRETTLSVVR